MRTGVGRAAAEQRARCSKKRSSDAVGVRRRRAADRGRRWRAARGRSRCSGGQAAAGPSCSLGRGRQGVATDDATRRDRRRGRRRSPASPRCRPATPATEGRTRDALARRRLYTALPCVSASCAVFFCWRCVAGCGAFALGLVPRRRRRRRRRIPTDFAVPPTSCAYDCPNVSSCPESTTPYVCQNTAAWATIPHADSCGDWDGGYPAPVQGQCTAVAPSGRGRQVRRATPDAGTVILPDGRRITPAGSDWVFDEDDLEGGLTTVPRADPGTSLVVTVDDGSGRPRRARHRRDARSAAARRR